MPVRQQVIPISPDSSSSSDNSNIGAFRLKPCGKGATKNTLVENDSLSSYSWPDETSCPNGEKRQSEEKADVGATHDSSSDAKSVKGQLNPRDQKPTRGKKDVLISFDNGQASGSNQELTYVQAYMKFMYWTCVSPFDPMKNEDSCATRAVFDRMKSFLQKICFATIMSLSILLSLLEFKYFLLENFSDGNLETFIDMSYFVLIVASKIYYVYLLLRQQWKFVRMYKSLGKLDAFKMQNLTKNKTHESPMTYTIILGTVSMIICIIHIIWNVGFMEWTPEKTVQQHFEDITDNILVWTLVEFENGTAVETFVEQNGNGLTATKIFLASLQMIMIFCSYLHNDALTNMMLTNAKTIKGEMKILEAKISNSETDIENISLAEFLSENGDWAHFQLLKQAINDDNDAYDSLLKYKHANNLMLFVYFVLNVFDGDFSLTYAIRLVYNIIRASYTYRIATQASSLNDAERKWIRRLAWKSNDRAFLEKVSLVLDELEKEPIGMGKGLFLIDESFLYRFVGSVGSVFVLQAQSRETKAE